MNEIDLVRRFRDEVPEPDGPTTARARDRWRDDGPGAGASKPARTRRGVKVLLAAAVIAVLAVVATSVLPIGKAGPDPAAAGLLLRFAEIARNAPAEPAPRPGQYIYRETSMETSYVWVSADNQYRYLFTVPTTDRRWLGADGSGRIDTITGQPHFLTAQDEATYEACVAAEGSVTTGVKDPNDCGDGDWGRTTTDNYGPGELSTTLDPSSLPADPVQLRQMIDDREIVDGPKGDWESFVLAADLIRESYSSPDVRAALYEVMAGLPGIEVVGATTDSLGRKGIALASTHDGFRYEVVFDQKTARILEERTDVVGQMDDGVYNNPGPGEYAYATQGQTFYVGTYLTFGDVVDQVGQRSQS